jgi:signal transduction histidine kinase
VAESAFVPKPKLRVLVLEDHEDDYRLLVREMARIGWQADMQRVQTRADMAKALDEQVFDLIISDWSMPGFNALAGLEVLHERAIDLPFIIVSGTIGEEAAVNALKAGAGDFVVKGNMARLGPAIDRELREAKTRAERRDALEALRQAVRVRDEFLTIAGHELRTPLTTLRLQVQAVLRGMRNGKPGGPPAAAATQATQATIEEQLTLVERSTHRLHHLVDRLLDIDMVQAEGLPLELVRTDLSRMTREVAERFCAADPTAKLEVQVQGPVLGEWDELRIEALLTNLIGNALKYGEGKPVQISVEDKAGEAVLTVTDAGIGIAPEDQVRIFERFGRAVSERRYGGFGVGLWLVKEITHAHGGRIELQSTLGGGSVFAIHLPKDSRTPLELPALRP